MHIATPDHWHAIIVIEACRNGKDVYCQKPETRTLREGPLMVAAARRYGRVVSGGSQRVLEDYREHRQQVLGRRAGHDQVDQRQRRPALAALQPAGRTGARRTSTGTCGSARRPGRPTTRPRCDGNFAINGASWRSCSDYSGGGMTDWGAHHFGGATFAVDVRELQPAEVIYHDEKDGKYLTYRYPNGMLLYHNHPGHGQPAGRRHAGREAAGEARARATRARAASTATSSTASRPAKSRSATSSWPSTPWPCATWASSPTS